MQYGSRAVEGTQCLGATSSALVLHKLNARSPSLLRSRKRAFHVRCLLRAARKTSRAAHTTWGCLHRRISGKSIVGQVYSATSCSSWLPFSLISGEQASWSPS